MAYLNGKTLFFITSPRTPLKMVPEIKLLVEEFSGEVWNPKTQEEFMKALVDTPFFEGKGSYKDMAFSARDRITRGPKALGFVDLKPKIELTSAGENFLNEALQEEALLRQLLKFQLPSPYHKTTEAAEGVFRVKPFLEIIRLIYTLKSITFDEVMIFGMQLTDYNKFEDIVDRIYKFREEKKNTHKSYKTFMGETLANELKEIFRDEISHGETKTRESNDASIANFIKTKASNLRDYTDACFRYLRATGIVTISQRGKSLSILPEKESEVEFFLKNISREPVYVNSERLYKEYLFNASLPVLYTDNRENLENEVSRLNIIDETTLKGMNNFELKSTLREFVTQRRENLINDQIERLKSYSEYLDIEKVYKEIKAKNYYDTPLMLEWNTWRAMTMIDGGVIKANLKFDDEGQPMSTAAGNMADIVCDYENFALAVEVTMQSGQKQYESEGEPVSRHLAKLKKECEKEAYCFFIAPKINEACIAHFYTLHLTNIAYYGGTSIILPLELSVFEQMIKQSNEAQIKPTKEKIEELCKYSMEVAQKVQSEKEWYNAIKEKALNWLAA